ncbi:MAG: 3'-5' exonuclease [Eubacterium sp.]
MFTDLPEIKLIISYLRLALHENDNKAFSYLYNKPNRWLNKKFFEEVERNSIQRNTSLYNSMFTIDRRNWRFKNGIDEIFEVINYIQNKKYSSVSDLVKYLRNRLNIDSFVAKGKQADDGSYIEQIDNMDSFENMCSKYSTIEQLITYIDELNKEVETKNDEKVKLLTIHKSKGMEYPVVFIIGCNEELLPHYKNDNIDDEKRLFYVAITRAEKELYLSYVDTYNNKTKKISSFIEDIKSTITVIKPKEGLEEKVSSLSHQALTCR